MDTSIKQSQVKLPRRVPADVSVHLFPVAHMQELTEMNPQDVVLNLGSPGTAIGVSGTAKPLYASLSRTSDFIAVSLAERQVGVDIEELQTFEQAAQLLSLLHPADQRRLGNWLARHRKHSFATEITAAWTRKEATLKLLGTGLNRDPSIDEAGSRHHPLAPAGYRVAQLSIPNPRYPELAVAWRE